MKTAPAGDRALLVELGDVSAAELHGAAASVRATEDVVACIAGHSSLFVMTQSRPDVSRIESAIRNVRPQERAARVHRVAVSFRDEYAPDLPELLAAVRLDRDGFIKSVASLRLVVRFIGFRGGFGYLDGWPPEWSMPRRATSRPVARGTFAIAGPVAGFYPIDSPGGWNLLGRTPMNLEHALAPGDAITIEPSFDVLASSATSPKTALAIEGLTIEHGMLSRVVGPSSLSRLERGVPPGGPFDVEAAHAANRAVGNEDGAPVLECALAGPTVVAERDGVMSWFGAAASIRVNDRDIGDPRQFVMKRGDRVAIGRLTDGARGYLAMGRGAGSVASFDRSDRFTIRAIAGPHEPSLREIECEVTPQLDRVGIRMRPIWGSLPRSPADLKSCGMTVGTIQIHPDGSVVVMGPDHPVTGGYLQPMTVISADRWKLAALGPGERVRFVAIQLSP